MNIKIRTGSNISNILQSTVTYEQAFTELIKNSIQSGASFIDIKLEKDHAVITDDGVGFDHQEDENGMTGFDKYFVFGNSYDMSDGSGIKMGHMGIGGKISNDKLTDSENPHWSIETKNKYGKFFTVNYERGKTEFLDDYYPVLTEISEIESNIKTKHGTIMTIHNLDSKLSEEGWRIDSIKSQIRSFFGELVRNKKTIEIHINGESLKFNYTLPGYSFSQMEKSFKYKCNNIEMESKVKFNLSLIDSILEDSEVTTVQIVSGVKICDFTLSNEKILDNIFKKIRDVSEFSVNAEKSIRNTFLKMRGFVSCDDLNDILDHTGMPAKDLSHHALREDHPITEPFYECVYKTIIDLLRGHLLLREKDGSIRHIKIASDIFEKLVSDMKLPDEMLVDYDEINLKEEMRKDNLDADIRNNLLESEIVNKTKKINNQRAKRLQERIIRDRFRDSKQPAKRGIRYSIKPFGEGMEKIMANHDDFSGVFCVNINSDNPKFKRVDHDNDQMGYFLAELTIRELLRYQNPLVEKDEIDQAISDFHQSYLDQA